ncbi:hypothetical protein VN97_g4472 [Penicillium thymicola]|uniref:Uncharacterized protein n=1 Tax=Penicillium thymicola TaxID=293382 RepID=A0AAI9X9K3_PENTH|nr:hypothetical protein VN97_g4472 [Penicillium thymicola]
MLYGVGIFPPEENDLFWFTLTLRLTKELHNSYMTTLRSVEARICATSSNPRLCLQVQEMAVVRRESIPRIFLLPQARSTWVEKCDTVWKLEIGGLEEESCVISTRFKGQEYRRVMTCFGFSR